jgi:hypothetical protein
MPKKHNNNMAADIIAAVKMGTKRWTKTVKSEERSPTSRTYRYARMTQEQGLKIKEVAEEVMPQAYMKASNGGRYWANARQIFYVARPLVQEQTGRPLDSKYFTQVLLPDFMEQHQCDDWKVAYDARGHFVEPHGGHSFGVGTLQVNSYLDSINDEPELEAAALAQASVKLHGPKGNFGAVLFVEKEGFDPLLRQAQIANKFDLALMSTKGMSVTAARRLADEMCHEHSIPLLLLHDFDKAGFSIAGTWQRDTRRYEFQNAIETIDLGLTLKDVEAMGLEAEHQFHAKGNKAALKANLRENGATEAEIDFMFADFDSTRSLRRVELNAMTSPVFIEFLERKLKEAGVEKIVPDEDLLTEAYIGLERGQRLQEAFEEVEEEIDEELDEEDIEAPDDLRQRVEEILKQRPELRWDAAVAEIVKAEKVAE